MQSHKHRQEFALMPLLQRATSFGVPALDTGGKSVAFPAPFKMARGRSRMKEEKHSIRRLGGIFFCVHVGYRPTQAQSEEALQAKGELRPPTILELHQRSPMQIRPRVI